MMAKSKNIHWFPGHMKKALIQVEEKLRLVDVVIEILDARAPFSSRNELLSKVTCNKPHLILLNKFDLANPISLSQELKLKLNIEDIVISTNVLNKKTFNLVNESILKFANVKNEKCIKKGMKPQPIRAMVIGIPNVGKSSFINLMAKRNAAGVQNKPGFTRSQQWIKVSNQFELLDTPGILPPSYDDREKATKLALIGAMREDILPKTELCEELLEIIKKSYLTDFSKYFGFNITETTSYESVIELICLKRGYLRKNNNVDSEKAESYLLKVFKDGKLFRVLLDNE